MIKNVNLTNAGRAIAAGALVVTLAACGGSGATEEAATTDATETVAEDTTATEDTTALDETTMMANPWTEVGSAMEAADVAGFDGFSDGSGAVSRLGTEYYVDYSAMDGLAQAAIEYPACEITVRKGVQVDGDDISGDYNGYAYVWTVQVGETILSCSGNREGESQKTIWTQDGYDYSIKTLGLGGDDAFGLFEEDLAEIVPNIG